MSHYAENQPTHGSATMSETASTPIVDEEIVCDRTQESVEIEVVEKLYGNKVKRIAKNQTKVPCDYCDDYVTLQTYVNHLRE